MKTELFVLYLDTHPAGPRSNWASNRSEIAELNWLFEFSPPPARQRNADINICEKRS